MMSATKISPSLAIWFLVLPIKSFASFPECRRLPAKEGVPISRVGEREIFYTEDGLNQRNENDQTNAQELRSLNTFGECCMAQGTTSDGTLTDVSVAINPINLGALPGIPSCDFDVNNSRYMDPYNVGSSRPWSGYSCNANQRQWKCNISSTSVSFDLTGAQVSDPVRPDDDPAPKCSRLYGSTDGSRTRRTGPEGEIEPNPDDYRFYSPEGCQTVFGMPFNDEGRLEGYYCNSCVRAASTSPVYFPVNTNDCGWKCARIDLGGGRKSIGFQCAFNDSYIIPSTTLRRVNGQWTGTPGVRPATNLNLPWTCQNARRTCTRTLRGGVGFSRIFDSSELNNQCQPTDDPDCV